MPLFQQRGSSVGRWIDKDLGVPVIWLLGHLRRRRPAPSLPPRRIGILITAAIGDTLLLSPVWTDIKNKWPEAEVTIFVGSSNAGVMPLLAGYDRVVELPVKDPLPALAILRRAGRFNLWIDAGQWARINAFYSYCVSADFTVGFRTAGQARHYLYDRAVEHSAEIHEIDNYRRLAAAVGVPSSGTVPHVEETGVRDENLVVLHLHSGGNHAYLKEWPLAYWLVVVSRLHSLGKEVYFTGGASDRPDIDTLIEQSGSGSYLHNEAGRSTLSQTAALLSRSALVISINTGIMHLAAALGCRVLALHGAVPVRRWGPLGKRSVSVESTISCSPCVNLGFDFGCPVNHCMQILFPATVIAILERILALPFPLLEPPFPAGPVSLPIGPFKPLGII